MDKQAGRGLGCAVGWLRKAAQQGLAFAQNHLGSMYYHGRGVERDAVRSYMWMLLAAEVGDETANANKSIVARRLTPAQIGAAVDQSQQWRMAHAAGAGKEPGVMH